MIVVYHNYKRVTEITGIELRDDVTTFTLPQVLKKIATEYRNEIIVWCADEVKELLNLLILPEVMHHHNLLVSYAFNNYMGEAIGYVDASLYCNENKEFPYGTWQMSGMVGVTSSEVLNNITDEFYEITNFTYFLNSVAKIYMPLGLLCYSDPRLLINRENGVETPVASVSELFRFVKEHYKTTWSWLLLLNFLIYEKKLYVGSFLKTFLFKKRGLKASSMNIEVSSTKKIDSDFSIDVIIPTIGRKEYLYDVLTDLKNQIHLPVKVIIVEQNPVPESVSELDYITKEAWPFEIDHTFTHQTGACNARNIALSKVTSDWVFLNDDDNRFDGNLISEVFKRIKKYGVQVVMTSYCKPSEQKTYIHTFQPPFFGSGNSFMKSSLLKKVKFNMALEFGYGEDTEFGLQLRNLGEDVIYLADVDITHLNAPRGGFRTKFVQAWDNDALQPKPSPTIMYVMQKYSTLKQLYGYKTTLMLKFYRSQSIKNPFKYMKVFKQRWERSIIWANKLKEKHEV
ncbi:glycosyl transferase [Neptunitalea chrysea]|uniref:Glycosyl transferase n=1 Tax=Neptunitalea chrysea TaxID=1647581 RepID=A0A9W6EU27_9FLAO|nr:glycosyltransferase family 2 protein [Neptunitalea chrysea]GLB52054.1 glycosyl transferase [Neptunitalea chrysea]